MPISPDVFSLASSKVRPRTPHKFNAPEQIADAGVMELIGRRAGMRETFMNYSAAQQRLLRLRCARLGYRFKAHGVERIDPAA